MVATPAKKKKKTAKAYTHLESLVSKTKKFKVEELLEIYAIYDQLVITIAFRSLLYPYTRFARTWLRDQARELLAGTDRNRLILTSRHRKATEEAFESLPQAEKDLWADTIKPKHTQFLTSLFSVLRKHREYGETLSEEEVSSLGVSRLVFDDMGSYFVSLMNTYPTMVADYCAAMAAGDTETAIEVESYLRTLETEVGIKRDHAWYVVANSMAVFDQVDDLIKAVTMAYARLLFRFAHSLRGVTTTEENFSAGYEGMLRAARSYDPVDGSAFASYCQRWVHSTICLRQRQSSVISLPATTWYQLSQANKNQIELTESRKSSLKERAEMFYASSANATKTHQTDEGADVGLEAIYITSPDAEVVLGDAVQHAQETEGNYEGIEASTVVRDTLDSVLDLLHREDPSLIFSVLLWALNSGIEATMLAEVTAPIFLSRESIEKEKQRHQNIKKRFTNLI